jgi:hypothetical protein
MSLYCAKNRNITPTTIRATAIVTDDEPVFFMLIDFSPQTLKSCKQQISLKFGRSPNAASTA